MGACWGVRVVGGRGVGHGLGLEDLTLTSLVGERRRGEGEQHGFHRGLSHFGSKTCFTWLAHRTITRQA